MIDIYTQNDIDKISKNGIIDDSIVIRGRNLKVLKNVKKINGDLGLSETLLESLGDVEIITGDLWHSHHYTKPQIKTLGNLTRVGKSAHLSDLPIADIGKLEYVGGNLVLKNIDITSLNGLSYIGGNLHLCSTTRNNITVEHIKICGNIKYWKPTNKHSATLSPQLINTHTDIPRWQKQYVYNSSDIYKESNEVIKFYTLFKSSFLSQKSIDIEDNYGYVFTLLYDLINTYKTQSDILLKYIYQLESNYPIIKPYVTDTILHYIDNDSLLHVAKERGATSDWRFLEDRLNSSIMHDADIAISYTQTSVLTSFGKSNLDEIKPFLITRIKHVEKQYNSTFFNIFYSKNKPYKAIRGRFHPEYYIDFYQNKDTYLHYKNIDIEQINQGYIYPQKRRYNVADHAVIEYVSHLLRLSEDDYRVSIGLPKIGEGWISETDLYKKICQHYSDYEVIHHGRPKWLGRQHLDIYIPKLNLGIEYQGLQHYTPVNYFGGKEGFLKTQERDKRKNDLCKKNNCKLIYVDERMSFDELIKIIDNIINCSLYNSQTK